MILSLTLSVSTMAPLNWEKTKSYSKKGFDKAWHTVDKLGAPVNRLSNRLGAEAFWPMPLDKESDKAARILRSFCKDGFYAPESEQTTDDQGKINRPKGKQRAIKKIPSQVVQNAKGLAIFTTMRTGLWVSGSGGSGVLLARIPETGEWSPPSGIMLHTAGVGFLAGVDIYDCVVIINTHEALEAFKKLRCTLGGEVSAAAGPVGMGGVLDSEVHKRQAPIWTYMKSKGLYAGVAVDGTIIIERTDENERFYGERISVTDILAGKARHPPASIKSLLQTVKAAQGDVDVDESLVAPPGETPGDIELSENDSQAFGVPAADDPDPYGVKALEAEGLFIREAGTKVRPNPDTFEFRPASNSPAFAMFARRSVDSSLRTSWRTSVQSYNSRGTQTDDGPLTVATSVSRASSRSTQESTDVPTHNPWDEDAARWDTVPIQGEEEDGGKVNGHIDEDGHEIDYDDDLEVHEVSNAMVSTHESIPLGPVEDQVVPVNSKRLSPSFIRARLVTIPPRPAPPALPPRHPQHTWSSVSSRDSTSPTALSHSSHSTEPTEHADPSEYIEPVNEPTEPSAIKTLQISTATPAAMDEDEYIDSASELPTDKDEFHSVNGEPDSDLEDNTITEDGDTPVMGQEDSTATIPDPNLETAAVGEGQESEETLDDTEKQFLEDKLGAIKVDVPESDAKFEQHDLSSLQGRAV